MSFDRFAATSNQILLSFLFSKKKIVAGILVNLQLIIRKLKDGLGSRDFCEISL